MSNLLRLNLIICIITGVTACNSKKHNPPEEISEAVSFVDSDDVFLLTASGGQPVIVYDSNEFSGVIKTIENFAEDLERVSSAKGELFNHLTNKSDTIIIVGTIGKSALINALVKSGKIRSDVIKDMWEASLVQVVDKPFHGIKCALVIAGSDKRGTIYGMYGLSRAMGVSPWYWWADVPAKHHDKVFIKKGIYSDGEPRVKYRGIFINDEAPALSGWVQENFGDFNHQFYEHIFELILRQKGNFLWPAMWGHSFNMDDPLNPELANEYGIVMGTSHHEPMNRAHADWQHYGSGSWDYNKNSKKLDKFWEDGIQRTKDFETIVTLGMRGDGDEPMSEESNIQLLTDIVNNQRDIITHVTQESVDKQPQVWALYKEVLDYYHKGMRVPDDVTLLLCDDNWGNVRYLPDDEEQMHPGGYGMYYHFDYVGGPRNYKWINKTVIPRVWEQMDLTYRHNVNKIWIVNVGDIKPMELPISFFLDYAWNPQAWNVDRMEAYTENWTMEQFGSEYATEIAGLLNKYTQYNSRRTAEMLDDKTYSLYHYKEFERVTAEYSDLDSIAKTVYDSLDDSYTDAYFQLVHYPVTAMANLYKMYYHVALNKLYAQQKRAATNKETLKVNEYYSADSLLTSFYNKKMADGKWNHMMDQTHIGYTSWQQPETNIIPETFTYDTPNSALPAICLESSPQIYYSKYDTIELFLFDNKGEEKRYFEIINQGSVPFKVKISGSAPFIQLSNREEQMVNEQLKVAVWVDWDAIVKKTDSAYINVELDNLEQFVIKVKANKNRYPGFYGFVPGDGYIAFNAADIVGSPQSSEYEWINLPGIGRTGGGIKCVCQSADSGNTEKDYPRLIYNVWLPDTGTIKVITQLSPTLDFRNQGGLKFGLSLNNEEPHLVNMHSESQPANWYAWVGDNCIETVTSLKVEKSGANQLVLTGFDPEIVFQRIIIDLGGLQKSYLGAPNTVKQ